MDKQKSKKDARTSVKKSFKARQQSEANFRNQREAKGAQEPDCDALRQGVYFIIPRLVKVLYGPYMFRGMMDYRTERLQGLKTILEKLGVTVELMPTPDHVNLVRVWFLEEMVFSCKLTQLIHGGDGELDPTCWEAAEALERFIKKVLRGLRHSKPPGPEELKRPFCPCFHVGDAPPRPSAPRAESNKIQNSVRERQPDATNIFRKVDLEPLDAKYDTDLRTPSSL